MLSPLPSPLAPLGPLPHLRPVVCRLLNRYVEPPTYVYYELEGYYQNHRRYVKSRSAHQLLGEASEVY